MVIRAPILAVAALIAVPIVVQAAPDDSYNPPVCATAPGGESRLDGEAFATYIIKGPLKGVFDVLSAKAILKVQAGAKVDKLYTAILQESLPDIYGHALEITDPATRIHVEGYFQTHSPAFQGANFPPDTTWSGLYSTDSFPLIKCSPSELAKPKIVLRARPFLANIRIRGVPDQLVHDRSSSSFKGDGAATFSILRDGVARTTNYKAVGAVGYALFGGNNNKPLDPDLIVFGNINYSNTTNFKGVSKPPLSNEYDVGLIGDCFLGFSDTKGVGLCKGEAVDRSTEGVWISIRPDYLWDRSDNSQIFTGNLTVTPLVGFVNTFRSVGGLSYEPVLVLKFDGGAYTRDGANLQATKNPTVARGGAQVGLNIISDEASLPASLNASYIYMDNLESGKNIGYFTTSLTLFLDKEKYIGLTINYNNGNVEATGKRQEQTTLGLSVKY